MLLNPARWPLKHKFVSIGLLLLLIPLSAVYLLQLVERSLVDNLKGKLKLSAQFQSLQLEKNSHWFATNDQDISNAIVTISYLGYDKKEIQVSQLNKENNNKFSLYKNN